MSSTLRYSNGDCSRAYNIIDLQVIRKACPNRHCLIQRIHKLFTGVSIDSLTADASLSCVDWALRMKPY